MTTVTVVWILDTNYHKILRTLFIFKFFPQIFGTIHLRSHIKNDTQCFIRYPDTEKGVEKQRHSQVF